MTPRTSKPRRKPVQRERGEQAGICRLFASLGGAFYRIGTTRRTGDYQGTMQSKGLPDVLGFLPARGPHQPRFVIVEAKAKGGRLRPEQAVFRDWCLACGVAHVTGGLDAFIAWLIDQRYLRSDQVAHHHVRAS